MMMVWSIAKLDLCIVPVYQRAYARTLYWKILCRLCRYIQIELPVCVLLCIMDFLASTEHYHNRVLNDWGVGKVSRVRNPKSCFCCDHLSLDHVYPSHNVAYWPSRQSCRRQCCRNIVWLDAVAMQKVFRAVVFHCCPKLGRQHSFSITNRSVISSVIRQALAAPPHDIHLCISLAFSVFVYVPCFFQTSTKATTSQKRHSRAKSTRAVTSAITATTMGARSTCTRPQ